MLVSLSHFCFGLFCSPPVCFGAVPLTSQVCGVASAQGQAGQLQRFHSQGGREPRKNEGTPTGRARMPGAGNVVTRLHAANRAAPAGFQAPAARCQSTFFRRAAAL